MFYNECWVDRFNLMCDEEEKKKRLIQWYSNAFDEMFNGEREERRHSERAKLDIDRSQNETIRS